jgi:Pol polyprotein
MAVCSTVVIKLATDEYDWHTLQSGKAQDKAFTADDQKKKKGKRSNVKCENCHKRGHTKDQCWAKGGGNEGEGLKCKDKDKSESSDKATAALTKDESPNIKAWAAIEDVKSNDTTLYVPAAVVKCAVKAECKIYDLGALRHMSPHSNNKVFHAIGMGDLKVKLPNGDKSSRVLLKDVLHAPDMTLTVVSIGCIMKAGYNVEFDEDKQVCWICKKKNRPIIGHIPVGMNNLFKVEHALSASTMELAQSMDILTLHQKLGHISVNAICALIHAGFISGLQLIDNFPPFICDSCKYAKTTCKSIHKEQSELQAQGFRDEVHTDVWGPSLTHSLSGRCYYVTFTDNCTCYMKLDVLHTKDEAFKAYKDFAAWAQTQHGMHIKCLHSNCSSEFTSNEFTTYL